jgi:hypothetical protein
MKTRRCGSLRIISDVASHPVQLEIKSKQNYLKINSVKLLFRKKNINSAIIEVSIFKIIAKFIESQ